MRRPAWATAGASVLKLFPCVSQPPQLNVTTRTPASTSRRAVRNVWPSFGRTARGTFGSSLVRSRASATLPDVTTSTARCVNESSAAI